MPVTLTLTDEQAFLLGGLVIRDLDRLERAGAEVFAERERSKDRTTLAAQMFVGYGPDLPHFEENLARYAAEYTEKLNILTMIDGYQRRDPGAFRATAQALANDILARA